MRKTYMLVAVALLCALTICGTSGTAHSAPPSWSLDRASLVLDAGAGVFKPDDAKQIESFLPQLGLSYSLTSKMSLIGAVERDFASKLTVSRAGARFLIAPMGQGQVGIGADLVNYADEGRDALNLSKDTSWSASIRGSWPVSKYKNGATRFLLVGSCERDPQNALTSLRLGLRFQLVGGRPWVESTKL